MNIANEILHYRKALGFFAISLTHNQNEAKDLVQETLLKALRFKAKFKAKTNLKAWLFTIMKNVFINQYRRTSKSKKIFDQSQDNLLFDSPDSSHLQPEDMANYKQIQYIVDQMPEKYKFPFQMHFEGYKYKEIAEHLHCPIGTVKTHIFEARKKLRQQLNYYSYPNA